MLTEADVNRTVAKAINFFRDSREPHAMLWLDVMHRLFGIAEFADALERFDAELSRRPDEAPVLRVLRRMADANNPIDPEDWKKVDKQTDRMLVSALYCDQIGLPPSFPDVLQKALDEGGYALTHGLLAWIWIRDNRCTVDDLKLEAAAFLCLARKASLVDLAFVQQVVQIQNADGGWGSPPEPDPDNPDASSWHSSILALLLLLHVDFPDQSGTAAG